MKYLLAMQETRGRSLGREDPLEKDMAIPSSILVPWTAEPGGLQLMGLQRVALGLFLGSLQGTQTSVHLVI